MKRYAPLSQQPVLGRSVDQMSAGERVVCEAFSDEQYLARLLDYMALEEQKGKDKFHSDHFQLFKVRRTPSRFVASSCRHRRDRVLYVLSVFSYRACSATTTRRSCRW